MKAKIRATQLLSGLALLIGIFFLISGIKGAIETAVISRKYETTEGYLCDYEIYSRGGYDAVRRRHTNDTYRLIYRYNVNGREYEAATDIGVGAVPEMGSVKNIRYNPDEPEDAFIKGPNSHAFKIFFGLFFIAIPSFFLWILMPEKKKAKKKSGKASVDGVGTVIGAVFLLFSYGILYFMTGELSFFGIVNFYRTSFILPMVIPILLFITGGYVFIRSIFFNHRRAARVCILIGISVLIIGIGWAVWKGNTGQEDKIAVRKADFTAVHAILTERDFETANIPTTYWFYDENKLKNVVSGIKEDMAFEYYEYTDGETTDGVFNRISYDISQDMEQAEREKCETPLSGGGRMFTLTEDGIRSIVLYKSNTVIYAYSSEEEQEIQEILAELGYIKDE